MTTNNTDGAALLPVTAEDRELFIELLALDVTNEPERIRRGDFDNWPKMQRIAAFRISHSLPGDVGIDRDTAQAIYRARRSVEGYDHVQAKLKNSDLRILLERLDALTALTPSALSGDNRQSSSNAGGVDYADAQRNIVRAVIDCYNTARPAGLSPVEYVHSKRLVRDAFASLSSVPVQIEQDELLDLIDDAISDSFDEEWNSRMGARHIVGALEHEGWAVVPLASLSTPTAETPPTPDRIGKDAVREALGMIRDLLPYAEAASTSCASNDDYMILCDLIVKARRALSATPAQPVDETERLREVITDPNAVHVNMLRGSIAKPSIAQFIHLYGEDAVRAALQHKGEVSRG